MALLSFPLLFNFFPRKSRLGSAHRFSDRFLAENLLPMAAKSRVLVVGSTGYIGKFIVEASAKAGHQTFALVRDSSLSHPAKSQIIQSFKSIGVTILTVISQSFSSISLSLNSNCCSVRRLFLFSSFSCKFHQTSFAI